MTPAKQAALLRRIKERLEKSGIDEKSGLIAICFAEPRTDVEEEYIEILVKDNATKTENGALTYPDKQKAFNVLLQHPEQGDKIIHQAFIPDSSPGEDCDADTATQIRLTIPGVIQYRIRIEALADSIRHALQSRDIPLPLGPDEDGGPDTFTISRFNSDEPEIY